ncbi:EAL domain-containing protein [Paeniglutamicibacter sp. NPDC091659]|uniref:sensor domain-containing phosphodiesterase n=1 Tax=Paeniglutamicibacter sp. NPDC091659 TaxID=3364389 RepID=UPI0037FEC4B9
MAIICIDAVVTLSIRGPLFFGQIPWAALGGMWWIPKVLALLVVPVVVYATWRLTRQQRRDRAAASKTKGLMDTVLATSREFLWAIDQDSRFTFCSPASRELLGYEPVELLGRNVNLVMTQQDLTDALHEVGSASKETGWDGLITTYRHCDGHPIPVEVSARPLHDATGHHAGFEGTTRVLGNGAADTLAINKAKARVSALLAEQSLSTVFQPIRSLPSGNVLGAEALTRFPGSSGLSPETWFTQAAMAGLGVELEILALGTALRAAAMMLPEPLYIALNVSPEACLDPRLSGLLEGSGIKPGRIVLEVTERHQVQDYAPLAAALDPLRGAGVRIAIDDAGAGYASMRHILQLGPEVIKLDRDIIAGIDTDPAHRALGAAMVGFAREIGAVIVAEGIETAAEYATVTALGMDAGQGYFLGRPTASPGDWAHRTHPSPGREV